MLEFRHVSSTVNKKKILDDISFSVPEHKITVILGKNGSGKSTLIRCINQLQKYDGVIALNGVPLSGMNMQEHSLHISVLPQILPQTSLSVYDLFKTGLQSKCAHSNLSKVKEKDFLERAVITSGLADKANQIVRTLSGGEQRLAFLKMILSRNTPITILDEPMEALDVNVRNETAASIVRASNEGATFILVLHDLEEAIRLGDYFIILDKGTLGFAGSKADCLKEKAIEKCFRVDRHPINDDSFSSYFFL
ncbi:MAG: ABC transporter ATP-binding protein [Clostridia bacterium]|nr:ABC transporter ATP-binding protein [Clostridia bacterium]